MIFVKITLLVIFCLSTLILGFLLFSYFFSLMWLCTNWKLLIEFGTKLDFKFPLLEYPLFSNLFPYFLSINFAVNCYLSPFKAFESSVSQGFALSPTLFLLFSDVLLSVTLSPIHSYASHFTIHKSFNLKDPLKSK